jgi:hypothetical protein
MYSHHNHHQGTIRANFETPFKHLASAPRNPVNWLDQVLTTYPASAVADKRSHAPLESTVVYIVQQREQWPPACVSASMKDTV